MRTVNIGEGMTEGMTEGLMEGLTGPYPCGELLEVEGFQGQTIGFLWGYGLAWFGHVPVDRSVSM